MILVRKNLCPIVVENRACFIETDPMLPLVAFRFARVPFKRQRYITVPLLHFHLKKLRHVAEFPIARFQQFADRQVLDRGQML